VVYTALDLPTVDGELARAVRRAGLAGMTLGPRRLATIHVRLSRVLDLTSAANRAALGVTEADLTADDSSLPQRIGEAAERLGYEGVLAPSAAGSGEVLAVFVDNRAPASIVEVVAVQDGYQPGRGPAAPTTS
jgi:RES domain-containing protein